MAHIEKNARLTAAMVDETLRKLTEPVYTQDAFMAMLKSKGRLTFGHSRTETKWRARFRRMDLTAGDGNPVNISFPQPNYWKEATLPMRNYNMGTSWNKFEELATRSSSTAIFRIADQVTKIMSEDFLEGFRLKLYTDGSAASTSKDIHGLESMFSVSGLVSGGRVGNPNDSYGGMSTALGNFGGSWTGTYPTGQGKVEYRFWSPLVVDYTNTNWNAATKTWPNTWMETLNYALTYGQLLQKQKYDVILLDPELKRQAEDSLIGKTQLQITQKSALVDAGIQTNNYNGVEIATEYGVPSGVGYCMTFNKVELMSMQGQLIGTMMADRDIRTAQELRAIDFYGNLKFEAPSYFAKLAAIS